MNSQNNSNSADANQTKDLEIARVLLEFIARYHDHKETMAHAAVLIQLGIVAVLFRMDCWPLQDSSHQIAVFIGYVLMWAIISGYMLWQLDKRREAACQVKELIEFLEGKAKADKLCKTIGRIIRADEGPKIGQCILWTADVLILIIALLRMLVAW